ncbi:MAG TPA: hypothetical protein VMU90_09510 [Solirubrobacteraceae bacterium]|nr:hypothetical protein [Solirubrobacteraceae bacterium]
MIFMMAVAAFLNAVAAWLYELGSDGLAVTCWPAAWTGRSAAASCDLRAGGSVAPPVVLVVLGVLGVAGVLGAAGAAADDLLLLLEPQPAAAIAAMLSTAAI